MDEKELVKYVSSFSFGDGALSSLKNYYFENKFQGDKEKKYENKKNSHYYIKQLSTHLDYIEFQKSILENITSVKVDILPAYVDKRGYHCREQLNLRTSNHPFFTKIRERMYFEGKKQLDPHYMKLWDESTLCYFYMDNGWIENTKQESGKIYTRVGLATHAYSYSEVYVLSKWMKEKFNLNFDVKRHKQKSGEYKFYLRNTKDNALRFLDKIKKYSFPSFEYKFSTERLTPLAKGDDIV